MTTYLVIDTNSLPVKGNLDSSFWAVVFRVCETLQIVPAISEVAFDEATNLRRETAGEMIESLLAAHSKLNGLTGIAPIYAPTVEDVSNAYAHALKEHFEIIPLDGEHAREAFQREARRIPPAREGKGGRDSAIWLTAAALARDGHEVHFVSANWRDFGKGALHEVMAADLDGHDDAVHYHQDVNSFLEAVATKVTPPTFTEAALSTAFADSMRAQIIGYLEAVDAPGLSVERVLTSDVELTNPRVTHSQTYVIDDAGLSFFQADVAFTDGGTDVTWASGRVVGWLSFDPTTGDPLPSQAEDLNLDFR